MTGALDPRTEREGILNNLAPFDTGPESCEATTFFRARPGWRGENVTCMKPKGHDGGHAGVVEW